MTASPEYLYLRRLPDRRADLARIEARMVPIPRIMEAASEVFDVGPRDMRSHYRAHHIARARHAVCKVASEAGWLWVDIGSALNRDRHTARDSQRRAEQLEQTDPAFTRRIDALRGMTIGERA